MPIHKKGDKQLLQNYRPVSLLPICSKIFEIIIFNPIFKFLDENFLLSPNKSGLCPLHSCENQLLSIVHDIYTNFDQHPTLEVRANVLYNVLQCGIRGYYSNLSVLEYKEIF